MSTNSIASAPWYISSVTTTATGSPTNRTVSLASSVCSIAWFMLGAIGRTGFGPPPRPPRGGEDGEYPVPLERGADVDVVDLRVRDGRPNEVDVAGAGQPLVL